MLDESACSSHPSPESQVDSLLLVKDANYNNPSKAIINSFELYMTVDNSSREFVISRVNVYKGNCDDLINGVGKSLTHLGHLVLVLSLER
jgi:hypothetical protein